MEISVPQLYIRDTGVAPAKPVGTSTFEEILREAISAMGANRIEAELYGW